jgi:nucleotide-binding universal stress UspA family protein
MPYKDILVHVDASRNCPARLAAAVKLAQKHQAHLIGLFVGSLPHVPEYVSAQLGPQVQEIQARFLEDEAAKAKAAFEAAAQQASGLSIEWRQATGDAVSLLALHGRYADLVILGQRDPDSGDASGQEDVIDDLVFELGRPILVVPYVGKYPHLGERVMVAWNASRESTRAVSDAQPLLAQAKKVVVLAINPQGGNNGHGALPGADIAQHLARHGVNAEAQHVVSEDVEVGDMLLSRASDEEVDLIVMGCYGHSRLREMFLGGASRYILRHMTVPVLLSH